MDDILLNDPDLNILYARSEYCETIEYWNSIYKKVFKRSRRNIENARMFIVTHCGITAQVIRYLLSGESEEYQPWIETATPTSNTLFIEADDGHHEFIIHDGKLYDSWYDSYKVNIREAPKKLIDDIRKGKELTFIKNDTETIWKFDNYRCLELDESKISKEDIMKRYRGLQL